MATAKKVLSLIQLERGMQLMPRIKEEGVALEMVATYLAATTTLLNARKDPSALDPGIDQAADLPGTEAAEIVADFFSQVGKYNEAIVGFLQMPKKTKEAIKKLVETATATPS